MTKQTLQQFSNHYEKRNPADCLVSRLSPAIDQVRIFGLMLVMLASFGLLLLQGCSSSTSEYHEAKPEDLVENDGSGFHTSEKNLELSNQSNPLEMFAKPDSENKNPEDNPKPDRSEKPDSVVTPVNAITVKTTEKMPTQHQNSDIKPFDPNGPVEPIRIPKLNEVVVAQSFPLTPKEIKLLIPDRKFSKVGPEDAMRISYDDIDLLKVLNMDPVPLEAVDFFPAWLKELEGKKVRIRGYMYPTSKAKGITNFSLARDTGICCFGPNGKVYDLFGVKMRTGITAEYMYLRAFDVVGTFHISPDINDDILENIYYIDDAVIIQ